MTDIKFKINIQELHTNCQRNVFALYCVKMFHSVICKKQMAHSISKLNVHFQLVSDFGLPNHELKRTLVEFTISFKVEAKQKDKTLCTIFKTRVLRQIWFRYA